MSTAWRLGLALPAMLGDREATWDDLRWATRVAEESGCNSVWYLDHFFLQRPGGRLGLQECLSVLTALAAQTTRVRLGSLVCCQSFRHPGLLAKAAATIQEVAGGRFVLGLGAGWFEAEYREFGFPFDRRVARFEEYVTIVTALLRRDTVTHRGRFFTLEQARLTPPAPPTPVWLATARPRMNALLGRFGDGWNGAWYGEEVAAFRQRLSALQEEVARQGRDPATIEWSVGVLALPTATGTDSAAALAAARRAMPPFASLSDDALRQRIAVGPPEHLREVAERFAEAGARTVIFSFGATPFSLQEPALLAPTLAALAR
ncbi:MAG: LLM class F420-dependent oxidoreductase [Dehalococcoidia bacterium]|nr:MAG: LLM class F420-dependent oxidoreductase [Dehalococcoidia bacterium]